MSKKSAAATKNPPGRPAVIRGRDVVVTLILSVSASETLASICADRMSIGDAIEELVSQYGTSAKMPEPVSTNTRWKPRRFADRTITRRLRMSSQALQQLDDISDKKDAVRSDVVEALIRQYGQKIGKRKGQRR